MRKSIKYFLLIFVFHHQSSLFCQTKEDLKQQKSIIEEEIRYTNELLKKTKSNKNESINYLNFLDAKIKIKQQLLITLKIEKNLLSKKIYKTKEAILKIEKFIIEEQQNLYELKEEYSKMIYAIFKQKSSRNEFMFIISSESFNQAYKRIIYLKQYSVFRRSQALKINESKNRLIINKKELAKEKNRLINDSINKNNIVNQQKKELESINSSKSEKQDLINKLIKSERLFKNKLQDKHKKSKLLDKKIRKIIEEEIKKSREEAKNNIRNSGYDLTPETRALSTEFENNIGKLPWPVEKGIIIEKYGKQNHTVFSSIETFNNGINIATDKNASVRVVFDGYVSRIFFIKGEGKAILVNHGEYFSVYSGLSEVCVKVGDKLQSKERIGVVLTQDLEKKTQLHFEIWEGYDKHDPSKWLYKAY